MSAAAAAAAAAERRAPSIPASAMLSAFNTAVADLLADLCAAFPGNAHFAGLADMHAVGCRANVRLPYTKFRDHVVQRYGGALRNVRTDDTFLRDHDFSEVRSRGVVDVLKTVWRDISSQNRACVLGHIDLIMAVFDRIPATGA